MKHFALKRHELRSKLRSGSRSLPFEESGMASKSREKPVGGCPLTSSVWLSSGAEKRQLVRGALSSLDSQWPEKQVWKRPLRNFVEMSKVRKVPTSIVNMRRAMEKINHLNQRPRSPVEEHRGSLSGKRFALSLSIGSSKYIWDYRGSKHICLFSFCPILLVKNS